MPRPRKIRHVCSMPKISRFGPLNGSESAGFIYLGVDEYETIRLIDLEGYLQDECADQMKIARSTVQGIYIAARKKIATALVHGKTLLIEGGEYRLCENFGACRHRRGNRFT